MSDHHQERESSPSEALEALAIDDGGEGARQEEDRADGDGDSSGKISQSDELLVDLVF